ncbi:MAG: UDP-N-acetylglucosamine 1-carboxyvinyltransferase, partial [Candidatus Krumholzibacteria bacterium]|nr:UDP-N-acetylglucosamine 1-carboxyvinyltransferase [Candidatus Krumholzibacteria bacterium]
PVPVEVVTRPYPGFPTDMQAQIMAACTLAGGTSHMTETIYTDRFTHVAELQRLGADIRVDGARATIVGVKQLSGAQVMATDLRASAALVLAGVAAHGTTTVNRVYHIDRGYERIETRLAGLGARIRREKS